MSHESSSQAVFQRLKVVCVPLLGSSLLSSKSAPNVLKLLNELINILRDVNKTGFYLTASLISYTFFPLSTILRRNTASNIPDQVLEKIFIALGILCEDWWWDCDIAVWEQIFILCGATMGGIEGKGKGKGKDRDGETKEAAARCLLALTRLRTVEDSLHASNPASRAQTRLEELQIHVGTNKFLPVFGQTLDSLLSTAESHHPPLQRVSLELLSLFIGTYASDDLIPSVLPGVVSLMTRVSLGTSTIKGWANGDTVAGALNVIKITVVKAVGDDVCIREGAIRNVVDLEDLVESATSMHENSPVHEARPYATRRTSSWLQGTSSQLVIAINSLTPLVSHPTPSALCALVRLSTTIIAATPLTLPRAQPLLLHFLLSLSNSDFSSVSAEAHQSLLKLLNTPSKAQHTLLQTLVHITSDNLSALPRLLPTHADAKVEHTAKLIEAVCRLGTADGRVSVGLTSISTGIGKLLGPTGGIEKWGWNLLSVLEFTEPPAIISRVSSAQLMLENNVDIPQSVPFPGLVFKNVFSDNTRDALERMFRALGRTTGDSCLFSVEWFANVGRNGLGSRSITAIWCACRLLEGVSGISLSQGISGDAIGLRRSKRLLKLARSFAKDIAELWDEPNSEEKFDSSEDGLDANIVVQHVKGISSIHETLQIVGPSPTKERSDVPQPALHKALLLQLMAASAGVLQAQFSPLLLYAIYPVLHSLVSSETYLSSTAFATLNFITAATSYASPSNLLLSNFDYALDAVSRRLSRRWLDADAAKVLALLVRLVGSNVVERAGDVVEECFDRLDEFHGYGVIVEGLIEVLAEVINVIREDAAISPPNITASEPPSKVEAGQAIEELLHWLSHRHDQVEEEPDDYGPAPREAWGPANKNPGPEAVDGEEAQLAQEADPNADPPPTPVQTLTKQIISRSLYFLTHESPVIRARILSLLSMSVSVLPEGALLPSIHSAWPFILNRLADPELFVVSTTASLVEALVTHVGSFMFRRIWDDIWPRFLTLLGNLDTADAKSALSRRGPGAVGTETAYSYSHRLYRSLIKTMTAALKGVHAHNPSIWQVLLAFRRFLHKGAHEELQLHARNLYLAVGESDPDVVWLVLSSTKDDTYPTMRFLKVSWWDIEANVAIIFQTLKI